MFTTVSMTGTGAVIAILASVLPLFGAHVDASQLSDALVNFMQAVDSIAKVVGFVLLVIGQLRRPDLHFGMVRRKPY